MFVGIVDFRQREQKSTWNDLQWPNQASAFAHSPREYPSQFPYLYIYLTYHLIFHEFSLTKLLKLGQPKQQG